VIKFLDNEIEKKTFICKTPPTKMYWIELIVKENVLSLIDYQNMIIPSTGWIELLVNYSKRV